MRNEEQIPDQTNRIEWNEKIEPTLEEGMKLRNKLEVQENGCWYYKPSMERNHYPTTTFRGKFWKVANLLFTIYKGKIKHPYWHCHTCDDIRCVNPSHIYAGTQGENVKDWQDNWSKKPKVQFCYINGVKQEITASEARQPSAQEPVQVSLEPRIEIIKPHN
jgi:hypothetical protein